MLDKLQEQVSAYLAEHQVAVVSTAGSVGSWAMPVTYQASGLEMDLLIPSWSDVAYHLEQDPRVHLVVLLSSSEALRWLEVRGTARPVTELGWTRALAPEAVPHPPARGLHVVFRVSPVRIDLIDESRGWGNRETLEC